MISEKRKRFSRLTEKRRRRLFAEKETRDVGKKGQEQRITGRDVEKETIPRGEKS